MESSLQKRNHDEYLQENNKTELQTKRSISLDSKNSRESANKTYQKIREIK